MACFYQSAGKNRIVLEPEGRSGTSVQPSQLAETSDEAPYNFCLYLHDTEHETLKTRKTPNELATIIGVSHRWCVSFQKTDFVVFGWVFDDVNGKKIAAFAEKIVAEEGKAGSTRNNTLYERHKNIRKVEDTKGYRQSIPKQAHKHYRTSLYH